MPPWQLVSGQSQLINNIHRFCKYDPEQAPALPCSVEYSTWGLVLVDVHIGVLDASCGLASGSTGGDGHIAGSLVVVDVSWAATLHIRRLHQSTQSQKTHQQ